MHPSRPWSATRNRSPTHRLWWSQLVSNRTELRFTHLVSTERSGPNRSGPGRFWMAQEIQESISMDHHGCTYILLWELLLWVALQNITILTPVKTLTSFSVSHFVARARHCCDITTTMGHSNSLRFGQMDAGSLKPFFFNTHCWSPFSNLYVINTYQCIFIAFVLLVTAL